MIDQSKIRNFFVSLHILTTEINTCGPYHRDDRTSHGERNAGPGSG